VHEIVIEGVRRVFWDRLEVGGLPVLGSQHAVPETAIHVELLDHRVDVAGIAEVLEPRVPRSCSLLELVARRYADLRGLELEGLQHSGDNAVSQGRVVVAEF
jgi:hypothetical protein